MKKITLITMAILLAAGIYTQNNSQINNKLSFGFKAGLNYSNVYDSNGEEFDADAKVGFAAGGFLTIPIGEYLGIQPEILFSQKGFNATGKVLGAKYEVSRTTNYIDIPILFVFKPIEYLAILAGPQYSYLIKQIDTFENKYSTFEQEQEFENENIRDNTFCFIGGIDFNLMNYVIGTRIGWDLYNNNGDGSDTTPRYKNVWGQLTLGYKFN